jgi:hypothetical protein
MIQHSPGTRNRRLCRQHQQNPPNTFDSENGTNDDIKFHENMLSNILPRIFRHTQSKDVIKVITMSFIVLLVILVGYLPSSSGDWSSPISENAFFPRHVRYLINEMGEGVEVQRLSLDVDHYPLKRTVRVSRRALKRQEHLNEGSEDYAHSRASDFETTKCKAQHPWQLMTFPTCNILYEYDLTSIYTEQQENMETRTVAHGHYRDVWIVKEFNAATRVLKTLRYKHDFEGRFFGRNRKDALISERMTKSPHVVDIYGFCGNSALFEYSRGGDITATVFPKNGRHNLTMLNKVEIATQLASALADLHNFDKEGEASVAHADVNPSQFVLIDGSFKLNDFNRGVLMQWSKQRNESCGYYMNLNEGKMRSPEEYSYTKQSEKVSVFQSTSTT